MAKGTVNKVILVGRLGSDPELRYTPAGQAFANFNIATNEVWKDQEGNFQEKTDWHRIVLWRHLAERANEYLKKGHRVYIEGKLQTRTWDDQDGNKRYVTEVVGRDMQFLEARGDGGGASMASSMPPPPGDEDIASGGSKTDIGSEDDLPF